ACHLRCKESRRSSFCPALEGSTEIESERCRLPRERNRLLVCAIPSWGMTRREESSGTACWSEDATIPSLEMSSLRLTSSGASRPATARIKEKSKQQRI